jgi:hypothetical protein
MSIWLACKYHMRQLGINIWRIKNKLSTNRNHGYFFRPPDWPYFFLPTLLFFQRDWLCDLFSGWLRAVHTACQNAVCCHTNYWTKLPKFVHRNYASLVNIDVGTLLQIAQQKPPKPWKKYSKKIYFQPTDPNFFTIWNWNHRYFFLPYGSAI